MSNLPIAHLSAENQQKLMEQIYLLMAKQVKSYHKFHRMGENTSIPLELAQELMESIEYTIDQAGGIAVNPNVEETLKLGQAILEGKLTKAKAMLDLVIGTAPQWQSECRSESICYLQQYLNTYDFAHLAHRGPDALFYPVLISPPEGILGIDICMFYLTILWYENQIMAGIQDEALEDFWNAIPAETCNQCEPLLINGIGKALLNIGIESLIMESSELELLNATIQRIDEQQLMDAADLLCKWLNLQNAAVKNYVVSIVPLIYRWISDGRLNEDLGNIFV